MRRCFPEALLWIATFFCFAFIYFVGALFLSRWAMLSIITFSEVITALIGIRMVYWMRIVSFSFLGTLMGSFASNDLREVGLLLVASGVVGFVVLPFLLFLFVSTFAVFHEEKNMPSD